MAALAVRTGRVDASGRDRLARRGHVLGLREQLDELHRATTVEHTGLELAHHRLEGCDR